MRIAERQQRHLLQIKSEISKPQSDQGYGHDYIDPGVERPKSKFRPGDPEKIDEAHKDQPDRDFRQQARVAFQIARKQQEKRHEKVKDQHDHRNHTPAAVQARAVKSDLFWLVAGPDNQQLRKSEIS